MYIYVIEHIKSHRLYVGQTTWNPNHRWISGHVPALRSNRHHNEKLQRAWNKYGMSEFEFRVIDQAKSRSELNELEIEYIKSFNSIRNGYNIKLGGQNEPMSESTKYKISVKQKQYNQTLSKEQIRRKMQHMSNGRTKTSLQAMANKQKLRYTKEYRNFWSDHMSKTYTGFVSPGGVAHTVTNLTKFCKRRGLEYTCMIRLVSGKRRTHKGWTYNSALAR